MPNFARCRIAVLTLTLLILLAGTAAADGYMAMPDIHGDRLVFCAEGDIWTCSDEGGSSRRLTTYVGREYFPRFSPDGKWLAFTGEYDGNRDVFIMPVDGGEPRRLTWHPASDELIEWTPDGKELIFRSWRDSPHYQWELFSIPAAGGDPEKLPLGWAARLDIDPDSGQWAFNRKSRETRTWKRYRGGTDTDIWVGDPKRADFRLVTKFDGTDAHPMWFEGRIYFISDQGGTYNIWSMKPDGEDRKRHTDGGRWDARFPGMGPDGRIVYMLAGGIQLFDPASGKDRKLEIQLPSERVLTRERSTDPGRYLTWFSISPEADRLAVIARGEIFSVPVEEGVTLPVSKTSGARESFVSFGPEGERILYLSDASREEAFHTADAWGRGDVKIVKEAGNEGFHFPPDWSGDGKWIAYGDNSYGLFVISAEGGSPTLVDRSERWLITDYSWSPDGRWLAYTKTMPNDLGQIFIYDTQEKKSTPVTGLFTDDESPAWDPDGRYLYFLSARNQNPLMDRQDYNFVQIRNERPYLVLLKADGENPFANLAGLPPGEDEEKDDEDEDDESDKDDDDGDEDKDKDDEDEEEEIEPVEIDLEGLSSRVVELPVEMGNYQGLGATSSKVFYFRTPTRGWGEGGDRDGESGPDSDLMAFDLEEEEADVFLSGVSSYSLATKADKMAIMKGRGELYVIDSGSAPSDLGENAVSLDGIVLELDPREEWEQIYHEAWRRMRDRYWDADMAGLDWKALRDQYAELLPLLANRGDLGDLIGELIGELSTGHTYVWGGDPAVSIPRRGTGLLGADLVREDEAFRVERIYRGDDADNETAPLLVPGVDVAEGQYILAVNGRRFEANQPFYAYMAGFSGKDVLLSVADDAKGETNPRDVVVHAIRREQPLRYADWVRRNREYVDEKSDGKFGYLHLPDMSRSGLMEFGAWFFPQLDKEGMVVDVRWNGGGFVSQIMLERFRRPVTAFGRTRQGRVDTYPDVQLNGPFVVLANEFAGSDGDIFPRAVQLEKLAPVIGTRTWGGVIGINIHRLLVDGGVVTYPFHAWWDEDWGWGLENRGIEPDIVIDNLPQELAKGEDAQLDRGLQELKRLHKEHPPIRPSFENEPKKSRDAFRRED